MSSLHIISRNAKDNFSGSLAPLHSHVYDCDIISLHSVEYIILLLTILLSFLRINDNINPVSVSRSSFGIAIQMHAATFSSCHPNGYDVYERYVTFSFLILLVLNLKISWRNHQRIVRHSKHILRRIDGQHCANSVKYSTWNNNMLSLCL